MKSPKEQHFKATVGYEGKYEEFTFWIIGISPDIEGDVRSEYKRLRASRGQGWDGKKYEFIGCYPLES
ncbi:MAG TPA: hypothetical protein DF698_05970 [Candidatus Atribacteria bacterium]|nr:hypothetical protein [Candidatus Atribacteria bacterium]